MVSLLRSGKFWLRFAFYGLIAFAFALMAAQSLLHYVFSVKRIQAFADEAVHGSGRTVRFSGNIGRAWLPRPTLTLRNVSISKANSPAAFHAKEMRIGLAWSNLWSGRPTVEKWHIQEAEIEAVQKPDGSWSLQDFWKTSGQPLHINRVSVENGRLNINTPEAHYRTENLYLNLSGESEALRNFTFSGTTHVNRGLAFKWHGVGRLNLQGDEWQFPALHINADVPFQNETVSLVSDTDLTWQPEKSTLQARNLRLRADSSFHQLHLIAQSPALLWKKKHISLSEISAVFTARSSEASRWDGSFTLSRLSLRPSVATISELELNGSHQSHNTQTTFNFSGPLIWQKNIQLQSEKFSLSTHQNNLHAPPQPRFSSQMEGSFTLSAGKDWTLTLNGLLDRQNTDISARYTAPRGNSPAQLNATVGIQKLSLQPYWNNLQARNGRFFPDFLSQPDAPRIHADINIGRLNMPGLNIDDLHTTLYADNQRITLANFRAGLYGGKTEGGISMANTNPPTYHLQQNTRGVQIRPLMQDLLDYHRIVGIGDAAINLTAQGSDRAGLTQTLNGSLQLNVTQGAWLGLDIAGILKSLGKHTPQNSRQHGEQTPFRHFSLTSEIRNGIGNHENAELTSDIFHITSSGQTDLNTQTVSENMLISNAKNTHTKPIPIKITGVAANPSVTLDYSKLTSGLTSPQEKQQVLADTLREQWQWLNTLPNSTSTP